MLHVTRDTTVIAIGQSHQAALEQNTQVSHADTSMDGQMCGQTTVW